MKLKRSEKWILAVTVLAFLAFAAVYIAQSRQEEVFLYEEGVVFPPAYGVGDNEKININTATVSQLQQLEGIGPALAEKIVEYRQTNGSFSRIEDIAFVSGIGSEKFEAIRDDITVD